MRSNPEDTVFVVKPEPIPVTVNDIGEQLACDTADKQAGILLAFACEVDSWTGVNQSWPRQCRAIAENLSSGECDKIAGVLEPLLDHLRGIPQERAEPATA